MYTSQQGITLNRLFSYDVRYEVPRYQRRYVWDETNWRTLCEDIFAQLGLEFEEGPDEKFTFKKHEQHRDTPKNREQRQGTLKDEQLHFTGLIVIRPISNKVIDRFEVIDGQQRLTTFQIILCVIRDIFTLENCSAPASEAERLIVNDRTVIERATSELTYKFWPTEYDRDEFEYIAKGEYSQAFDKETNSLGEKKKAEIRSIFPRADNHNIFDVYDYFYKLIKAYIGKDWDYKKLGNLLNTIKTKFELVQITLNELDQWEKIFESINATGRKLSEFDYLRNNLFLRARQLDDNLESKKSHSDIFYEKHWKFENNHSYWNAEKLESFLETFLTAKLGPYCLQSSERSREDRKAFEVYQKFYYKKVNDKATESNFTQFQRIEYEFSELKRYAEAYQGSDFGDSEFVDQSDTIRFHMKFYDDLNIKSLLPFILHLQCEANQTIDQLEVVFKALESYLVRRMLYTNEVTHEQIYSYFSDLIDKNQKFDVEKFVLSLDWPDDDLLVNHFKILSNDIRQTNRAFSRDLSSLQLSYIFYRIERYVNEKNRLSFNDFLLTYEPTRISSEQELRAAYGERFISDDNWEQLQNNWLSIGNFAFSTENKINPGKVDNYSFEETRKALSKERNANLKLNNEICKLNRLEAWGPTEIRERQGYLFEYFGNIWPDQKSILEIISRQTRKTCKGSIMYWRGSFGAIKSSDLEKPIKVKISDFRDSTTINPVKEGQKVKFEIDQIQSGKNVKPINLVRIKE